MNDLYRQLVSEADRAIEEHSGEAIELSDHLARNPEVSGQEFESSKKHVELLSRYGFEVKYPFLDIPMPAGIVSMGPCRRLLPSGLLRY